MKYTIYHNLHKSKITKNKRKVNFLHNLTTIFTSVNKYKTYVKSKFFTHKQKSGGERQIIFEIHLKKRNRDPKNFDVVKLVERTDGFTGAEIEASIVSAMYEAFYYSREINNNDLEKAIKETVPLSVTMAESINALRKWANNRARNASQKF